MNPSRRALLALLLLAAGSAQAARRYAVVVGNNDGNLGEVSLHFAEDDADKVAQTLLRVGGFDDADVTVLQGRSAGEVRRTLISINDRLRREGGPGALLLVYYSGHADAQALHLGGDELALSEVEQLVRGSAAGFRVLVVDACRSGALTKVKGGHNVEPFDIALATEPDSEGYVVLTAAAAGEDAQESDDLRGSFFTHHLTSGLLGAADENHDAKVTLDESYRYAFAQTVKDSSATLAGTQHPTFHYDLRGKGDVILGSLAPGRAGQLTFPVGIGFVVFIDGDSAERGHVAGEVTRNAPGRGLVLSPGRYFVRGRGKDVLYEGLVTVDRGAVRRVLLKELDEIAYARLVRKGGEGLAQGAVATWQGHTPWLPQTSFCNGVGVAWPLSLRLLSVVPRAHLCSGVFENPRVKTTETEAALDVALVHVFDLPWVSLEVGGFAGVLWIEQRFTTTRIAPARRAMGPGFGLLLAAQVDVGAGLFLYAEGEGRTALLPGPAGGPVSTPAVLGWNLGLGAQL